jgi:15-cis-phytoene synthase
MPGNVSYCEQMVRDEDRDRFLATLFAPAHVRPALFSIYAFDIEIAHISARVSEPLAGEVRLQWWRDVITGVSREQAGGSPVAAALIETIGRYTLPDGIFADLIEAQRDALYRNPVETIDEFEHWASKTHGGIVALAARILSGGEDSGLDHLSEHAGIALACMKSAAPGENFSDFRDLADRNLALVRASLPAPAAQTNAAFLPLALVRPTLREIGKSGAMLPQWRRQWILWRASRNLAKWL